jgi:hypothetical protein
VVNAKLVDVDGLIMNHMNTLKKESIDNKWYNKNKTAKGRLKWRLF